MSLSSSCHFFCWIDLLFGHILLKILNNKAMSALWQVSVTLILIFMPKWLNFKTFGSAVVVDSFFPIPIT